MASVQELLLAAQTEKSPFQSLLEGATTGFVQAQSEALPRARIMAQMELERQDRERLAKQDEEIRAQLSAQTETQTKTAFGKINGGPKPVLPSQKWKETIKQTPTGHYAREYEEIITKPATESQQSLIDERAAKRADRRENERVNLVTRFNADPSVKKAQQAIDGANMVRDLALSDNPIAHAAVPTFMARASGEVGALTEADKAPFGGSQAILARLNAAVRQNAAGKLTAENRKFLQDLSDTMERRANSNMDNLARQRSKQYGAASQFNSPQDIFSYLRPGVEWEMKKAPKAAATSQGGQKVGRFIMEVEGE